MVQYSILVLVLIFSTLTVRAAWGADRDLKAVPLMAITIPLGLVIMMSIALILTRLDRAGVWEWFTG